jgi:hypothetical protein
VLAFSLTTTGCGAGVASTPRAAFSGNRDEVLQITVRNQQLNEARVWLWVDGQRQRLGSVRGNENETFFHPINNISTVHMEFDLTLGQRCITANVSLGPGDVVEAVIPPNLNMMAAVCRRR